MNQITYESISAVNAEIKTTKVKDKDYAEVPQRVKAFRKLYPAGTIETEIVSMEDGVCVMRALARTRDENGNDLLLATGTAYEKENSTFINKTSYIENCETSAIGRALGFCGFGIDTSIASAEEVGNAIENQKANKKISPSEARVIKKMLEASHSDVSKFLECYKVDSVEEMTAADYVDASKKLSRKLEKMEGEECSQSCKGRSDADED